MDNFVDIKITGKDVKRFILSLYKRKYNLYNIKYISNYCILTLNYRDYLKLKEIKTIYEIDIVKLHGFIKIKFFFNKYRIFIYSCIFGFVFLYFLSSLILEVEVINDKKDIRDFIEMELKNYGISKYHFSKSFYKNEDIANSILKKYKEDYEWISIKRSGNKYIVTVNERKINNSVIDNTPRNIIAKRNGIITSIKSSHGEIIKKVNDYVNKGDILISGTIMNNENIVDNIRADGTVFAEVWYNVKVLFPFNYKEEIETGDSSNSLTLNLFNNIYSTSNYKNKNSKLIFGIYNDILPIKIGLYKDKEVILTDNIYSYDFVLTSGIELAKSKLIASLGENDSIISEKCLKIEEKDSKIILDIFFRVNEDITDYGNIEINNQN